MSLKTIATKETNTSVTIGGGGGSPYSPRNNAIADVAGIEEYQWTKDEASTEGSGPVELQAGSQFVFGDPVTDTDINFSNTADSLNISNAPYFWTDATPVWDQATAYSVDDVVNFNGTAFTCTSAVSAATLAVGSLSVSFDNTGGTTGVNSGQQGLTFTGFTSGTLTLDEANGTGPSIYTTFRIQNDTTDGFFAGSGSTQFNIFGVNRNTSPTINQWITAQVVLINDPSTATFRPEASDWMRFTAAESTSGGTTTLTLTPKAGVTWPGEVTLSTEDFSPYNDGSFTLNATGGNSNPTVATGNWTQAGTISTEGHTVNANSQVPVDADGFVSIQSPMTWRVTGTYEGTDSGGDALNYTMFQSDSPSCRPVFYGTKFVFASTVGAEQNMNFIGQANKKFNVFLTGAAAPQFHSCSIVVNGTSYFRWGSRNYIINGLAYVTYGSARGFEFPVVPFFPPKGLSLSMPAVADLRGRSFINFCTGRSAEEDTHVFENPSAPNYVAYDGFNNSNKNPSVGILAINPTDAPPIPYATTQGGLSTSQTKTLAVGSRDAASNAANHFMQNTFMAAQRVRITAPSTGWTYRVFKTKTTVYDQDSVDNASKPVFWQNRSRTRSVGGLINDNSNAFNNSSEFFPSAALTTYTANSANGYRDVTVLKTAEDGNKLLTNDIPVYYAYDGTVSSNTRRADFVLPAWASSGDPTSSSNTAPDEYFFYAYKVIAQHDEYGTSVFTFDFDPSTSGTSPVQGTVNLGSKGWNNYDLSTTTTVDTAFVETAASYTAEIDNIQEMYDAIKTYERLRASTSDYDSSHRTSDTTFLTRNSKEFHTIDTNWVRVTTGNSVSSNGTNLSLKTASGFIPGSLTNVDEVVISGNMDMNLFPSNAGITVDCATATNLGGTLDGQLDTSGASTTTNALTISKTGKLLAGSGNTWGLAAWTTQFDADDELIFADSTGNFTASGVANLGGRHTGTVVLSGTGSLAHIINGTTVGAITSSTTGSLTANGTVTGNLTNNSGQLITQSGFSQTSGNLSASGGTFAHSIAGTSTGTLTLGAGNSTVSGNITGVTTIGAGASTVSGTLLNSLTVGAGVTTLSGDVTGAVILGAGNSNISGTLLSTLTTGNGDITLTGDVSSNTTIGDGSSTIGGTIGGNLQLGTGAHSLDTDVTGTTTITGNGKLILRGTYGGKVTAVNSTTFHDIDATISAGGLQLGTSASGTTLVQGSIVGPVTIGNGVTTLDAATTGNIIFGNGATTVNSVITGNVTHGTGFLTLGASSDVTGTLTKSGSTGSNRLTVSAGADISGIDLVVTTGTLEIFGVSGGFKSISGNVNFNVATTSTIFQIDSALPTGRAIFKDRSAAAGTFLMDVAHTEGVTTTLGTIVNNSASPTNYDIYYKPDNTFGASGVFYLTTFVKSNNNAAGDRTVDVTTVEHPDVLTKGGEEADLTGLTATLGTVTTGTTGTITVTGAGTQIAAPKTQGLLMRVTNDANYLRILANNNATVDIITPDLNDGTIVSQADLTLTAATQQSITAVVGTGSGSLVGTITVTLPDMSSATIQAVFIFPNPAGLTGSQAETACKNAIEGLENVAGWTIKNDGGNLLGLKPQGAYVKSTDYKGNIE